MAKIRVFHRKSGKKGTIDESQFDSKVFGRLPPAVLESKAIPATGGTIGFLGSLIPGMMTGGLGLATTPAFTAGGYAGGDTIRRNMIDLLGNLQGVKYESPDVTTLATQGQGREPVGEMLGDAGLAAMYSIPARPLATALLPRLLSLIPGATTVAGRLVGGATERASQSGMNPSSALTQQFGTVQDPNKNLFERLGTMSQRPYLSAQVGKEIKAQRGMSFPDVLAARTGSYSQAPSGFFEKLQGLMSQGTNLEGKLAGNYGRAYSNVLHQEIPQTQLFDAIVHGGKQMKTVGSLGGLYLLAKLLFGGGKEKTNVIQTITGE